MNLASLVVTQKMPLTDLINGLAALVARAEHIGRMRIVPCFILMT
jgi:hypothetical protein